MFRVACGIVSLFVSLLFVARSFDLLPDANAAETTRRQTVCECLAVKCALAGKHQSTLNEVEMLGRSLALRDRQLLSIGVRDVKGPLLVDIGEHGQNWNRRLSAESSPTQLTVPILLPDGTPWVTIEMSFRPLPYSGAWRFVGG